MNKKKGKSDNKQLSRRDFIVSTAVAGLGLTVFGCKKTETPAPAAPTPPTGNNDLKIGNINIPSRLTFPVNTDFSFQGSGFAMGDQLVFVALTDATRNFTIQLKAITTNNCTFTIPANFTANSYRISVTRGTQSLLLGSSTIEVPFAKRQQHMFVVIDRL